MQASKIALVVFGLLIGINLVVLDVFLIARSRNPQTTVISPEKLTLPAPTPLVIDTCGPACETKVLQIIQEATASTTRTSATPLVRTPAAVTQPTAKEFFVPLGAGSTTSSEWVDVPGAEAFVDSSRYSSIAAVYFEASLRIPTKNGRVYARLFNVTDKHPVWFSEVSTENETGTLLSAKITLDPGGKVYRVQMKTTLQYQSIMDQSRIRIETR